MPKVSVVIPVYNVAPYLRQCLDSVVNQTLRDIEIICVDDGSTDGSAAILAEYAAKDPRVKVLTREHTNAGAARNAGMAVATGEYLGFVDSDDWCDLTLFEKAYAKAKTDDAEVVEWRFNQYDVRTKKTCAPRVFPAAVTNVKTPFNAEALGDGVFAPIAFAPWCRLVRRAFAVRAGLSFQELARTNDVYFCCLVRALAPRQTIMDEVLYTYRTGAGTNLQANNGASPQTVFHAWNGVAQELERRELLAKFRRQLVSASANSFFYTLNSIADTSQYVDFFDRLRQTYSESSLFSQTHAEDIASVQTATYFRQFKEKPKPMDFLVAQGIYCRNNLTIEYWERLSMRKRLDNSNQNVKRLEALLNKARQQLAVWEKVRTQWWYRLATYISIRVNQIRQRTCGIPAGIKLIRKTLKLFVPAWIMSVWLKRRYHLELGPVARSRPANAVLAALPYAIYVIMSQRVDSDRRPRKYFLPYGFMKKRMALVFGEDVDPSGAHECHGRFVRWLRNALPYGLVLWWDNEGRSRNVREDEPPFVFDASAHPIPDRDACDHPIVSFIVPVYNVARYLTECLESLRTQTLSAVEIVCVDDGSSDDSARIIRHYAAHDKRFVAVFQENAGVSAARNRALLIASGRYVSFVDGDDWLDGTFAEDVSTKMSELDLDMCFFDFECFHYKTRKPLAHSWQLSRHFADFPHDRVFALGDLRRLMIYESACTILWKKSFLDLTEIEFSSLALGEDLHYVLQHLLRAGRIYALNRVYYHYRRQSPRSATTRLGGGDILAQITFIRTLGRWCSTVLAQENDHVRHLVKQRLLYDVLYYGEKSPGVLAWLQREGFRLAAFTDCDGEAYDETLAKRLESITAKPLIPSRVDPLSTLTGLSDADQAVFRAIMEKRATSAHDLYIVVGQLNSVTNEPLDSWTFFQWLQSHSVPSRYVMWRKHKWYEKIKAETSLTDVVALDGDGMSDIEFVTACADVLPRVKAVVMENTALHNSVRRWLYHLPDCQLVFLQHGVTFWKFTKRSGRTFSVPNVVNVSSEGEKAFLETRIPPKAPTYTFPRYAVAGLPRFDLLKDERAPGQMTRIVFVMFTWRYAFNTGKETFLRSRYLDGIKRLLSKENLARLARKRIRVVLAPHHHLVSQLKNLRFGLDVEIAQADEVSYWIRHADCCVTDYSSVSFDFVFLHKPTIYWIPDRNDPILEATDREEQQFARRQTDGFYNSVDSADNVVDMIEYYADRDFVLEPEKCAIGDTFFAYKTGICGRLHEELEKIAAAEASIQT